MILRTALLLFGRAREAIISLMSGTEGLLLLELFA